MNIRKIKLISYIYIHFSLSLVEKNIKAIIFTSINIIYTQCLYKQRNGVDVYNVQSNWREHCLLTSSVTSRDTMLFMDVRGWFRKFCHRCYNFVNIHDRLLYYTLTERATFLLYNDAKTMHERNKYFEIHALKDTWGKTTGTFS